MTPLFTGAVATAYVGGMVGLHRWNVWRLRAAAGGFSALRRLDWTALFEGLDPGGDPTRAALLAEVAAGRPPPDVGARAEVAGFSGGQAQWLEILAAIPQRPDDVVETLERRPPTTAGELYLREHLRLVHQTHALNLEVSVFAAKRQLARGLERFGDAPALFFARALASSLIGFNRAAIDDLARAVYYSRQGEFYVQAVLDTPFLEEARPALVFQCRQALPLRDSR